ncbi:MAG: CoA transferase subunit A [Clostridia bacterium]|jgi:acetate CoA/acetoacetate CoA-transferase alpha subunit|nr:CoA transferase subunit A [Clostridia bacterium]MCI2015936.1 CoA transferase subunit A [Clostridia bacterium]
MIDKIKTAKEALSGIKDGNVIMIGGFGEVGVPEMLVDTLAEMGTKNLTVIDCDAGRPGRGVGKLLRNGQIKKLIATHVGINPECAYRTPETPNIYNVEYVLMPQGTFSECIRAGGYGLGGVITPVGIGTVVEEGKQKINIKGKEYLVEEPLRADFALIRGSVVDKIGNVIYKGSTRNFNPIMATAADHVIVGAEKIVETGDINPDYVMTPGILVESIVGGEKKCRM